MGGLGGPLRSSLPAGDRGCHQHSAARRYNDESTAWPTREPEAVPLSPALVAAIPRQNILFCEADGFGPKVCRSCPANGSARPPPVQLVEPTASRGPCLWRNDLTRRGATDVGARSAAIRTPRMRPGTVTVFRGRPVTRLDTAPGWHAPERLDPVRFRHRSPNALARTTRRTRS